MDKIFFMQLELPDAKYNLEVGSGSHGEQTGRMLIAVEKVLVQDPPDIVLVEGDTNSVLAGALTAQKLGINVGHVEAGLRSYDRSMPEEINRILVDHCSDLLFAPTEHSASILFREGIPESKVFVTGNTIVDAVYQNLELAKKKNSLNDLGVIDGEYYVATLHRQENVDKKERFSSILKGLELVSKEFESPVYYPVHPRAKKMMDSFGLDPKINLIEPVDYLSFLRLLKGARLVLTDSGGIQEEACVLQVPCVTLRDNTERPETVEVGANIIAGTNPNKILSCTKIMLGSKINWVNPFGDGTAAKKIINICTSLIS
jgi:UDP-N-acetylglucosamine 2-epimerase (non-hydrolysing)